MGEEDRVKAGHILLSTLLILALLCTPLVAGPPYETDDPDAFPLHTGEFYVFTTGGHSADGTALDAAPGIELNYSFLQNTFFHLVMPLSLSHPSGGPSLYGPGDIELGFKWQLMRQEDMGINLGLFPIVTLPTGSQSRGLGSGETQVLLPVWLGKDIGDWTSYGGGGYWINPGEGNRDWWFTGLMLQRQLTNSFALGAEIFHQTPDAVDGPPSTGFNIGGSLTLSEPYQLLFSAGRNLQNSDANRFSFYLALYRVI